jgi:hypothetical protein
MPRDPGTSRPVRRPEEIAQQSISTMVEHWSALELRNLLSHNPHSTTCSPTSPTAPASRRRSPTAAGASSPTSSAPAPPPPGPRSLLPST